MHFISTHLTHIIAAELGLLVVLQAATFRELRIMRRFGVLRAMENVDGSRARS